MQNIKRELINIIPAHGYSIDDISWGWIAVDNTYGIFDDNTDEHYYEFDKTDNNSDITNFINSLDVDYNDGYGTQYVDGIIMMNDNSWFERKEYDGSEWWAYCTVPISPKEQRKLKEANESKN